MLLAPARFASRFFCAGGHVRGVALRHIPITRSGMVVGFPAGGGFDTGSARRSSMTVEKTLGQPVVVENKPAPARHLGAARRRPQHRLTLHPCW